MSRLSRTLVGAAALLGLFSSSSFLPSGVSAESVDNWTPATALRTGYNAPPVWEDNFSGPLLDTGKWTPEDIAWPHNGELQYYSPLPKYTEIIDGKVNLMATNDSMGGRAYTSARIDTHNTVTFKHGLFAARIKMTKGQGLWPAFWMFGTGPKYSEIDIAEMVGGTSALNRPPTGSGDDASYGALIHFSVVDKPTAEVTKGPGGSFHAPAGQIFHDDFHVMWLEWTDTEVWAGLDGDMQRLVLNISDLVAFEAHMYLILNVAIGGSFPGAPDNTTIFPQVMQVDWVRVWARNNEDIMLVQNPGASSSSSTAGADNTAAQSSSTAAAAQSSTAAAAQSSTAAQGGGEISSSTAQGGGGLSSSTATAQGGQSSSAQTGEPSSSASAIGQATGESSSSAQATQSSSAQAATSSTAAAAAPSSTGSGSSASPAVSSSTSADRAAVSSSSSGASDPLASATGSSVTTIVGGTTGTGSTTGGDEDSAATSTTHVGAASLVLALVAAAMML